MKRGLLHKGGPLEATTAPQFSTIASIWAWCIYTAGREARVGPASYRRGLVINYLYTMLQIATDRLYAFRYRRSLVYVVRTDLCWLQR